MNSLKLQQSIKASAPAKLILSGEHSVVYGKPALAMAVDRFAETTLAWRPEHHSIAFYLRNLGYTSSVTLQRLRDMKHRAQRKYEQFLLGECTICDVLQRSFELLQYTFIQIVDRLNITLPQGIAVHTSSNIPIGCGMGSSAASIVSVIHAVSTFLDLDMQMDAYLQLGQRVENLQHGYSSGLDLYLSLKGGCNRFENGVAQERAVPQAPMYLVNTGQPATSTGECVGRVKGHFENNATLLEDFAAVTEAFDQALQDHSVANLCECVRANHRLLVHIGVVPEKVQHFIAELEQLGASAKICGAGACEGQKGGMVLVITEEDVSFLVDKYKYMMTPLVANTLGIKLH